MQPEEKIWMWTRSDSNVISLQKNTDRDIFEEMKTAKEEGRLDSIIVSTEHYQSSIFMYWIKQECLIIWDKFREHSRNLVFNTRPRL